MKVQRPRAGIRRPATACLLAALSSCATTGNGGPGDVAAASSGGAPGAPGEASAGGGPGKPAGPGGGGLDAVSGRIATRYRYRAVDGADDHDVASTIALDIGDPERHPWTGHLLGWLSWDVDGGGGVFSDITDSYDGAVTTRLYSAYAERHGVDGWRTLRVGRQELAETPVFLTFDGVRAETDAHGKHDVELEGYAGVPAHFFESSPSGDLVAGLAATARPWKGGRVRVDWMHLEDESLLGDLANDLVGLSVRQRATERLSLDGRATMLEGDGRDLALRSTYVDPDSTLLVSARYKILFNAQQDLVQELDPFTATLLTLHPYQQATLLASKDLNETVALEGGLDVREVTDTDDEGEFNRDFARVHTAATWRNVADLEADLRLTAERWDATGSDATTWGADLEQRWGADVTSNVGSYFALYKYDFLLAEERDHVRVYYAGFEWDLGVHRRFDVRYEFENGPLDEYHLLRVGMRWTF